ncbi:MAG: flagellar hook-length control protein FliK [Thermodesulfobacteriota bacterium]|nr:flagellar hook-length control protein FliK [Thermodesulfobacteriota bacterium]
MTSIPVQTGYVDLPTGHLEIAKTLCEDTPTALAGLYSPMAADPGNGEKGTPFSAQIAIAKDRLKDLSRPIHMDGIEAPGIFENPYVPISAHHIISTLEQALNIRSNDSEKGLAGASDLFASAKQRMWEPLQAQILTQILEQVPSELGNGQTEATIQLQPEILGRLHMHVSSENGQARLTLSTHMPIVKEILQDHLGGLQTELANHGIPIDNCDVSLVHGPHDPANALLASAKQRMWEPLQAQILTQILEQVPSELGNGQTEATIQLQPEILGRLHMHLSSENDQARLTLSTHMPIVKEILQDHLGGLQTELANHGIPIDNCDVSLVHGPHDPANALLASAKQRMREPLQAQILTQILEQVPSKLGNGQTEATIQLQPQVLGSLRMSIYKERDQATLKISTNLPIVEEMLQDNIAEIKAGLQGQGVQIDKCHVVASYDGQVTTFHDHGNQAEGLLIFNKNLPDEQMLQAGSNENENAHLLSPSLERTSDTSMATKQVLPRPFETQIFSQIAEKAALNIKKGRNEMRIDLKPPALGHLRMHISTENDLVILKISTQTPMVKEILESNINQLKTALQDHGLQIEKFDVLVFQDSHEHARSHQNGHFQGPETEYGDNRKEDLSLPEVNEEGPPSDNNGTDLTLIDFFA